MPLVFQYASLLCRCFVFCLFEVESVCPVGRSFRPKNISRLLDLLLLLLLLSEKYGVYCYCYYYNSSYVLFSVCSFVPSFCYVCVSFVVVVLVLVVVIMVLSYLVWILLFCKRRCCFFRGCNCSCCCCSCWRTWYFSNCLKDEEAEENEVLDFSLIAVVLVVVFFNFIGFIFFGNDLFCFVLLFISLLFYSREITCIFLFFTIFLLLQFFGVG